MPAGNVFSTTVAFLETNRDIIDKVCDVLAGGWARWASRTSWAMGELGNGRAGQDGRDGRWAV